MKCPLLRQTAGDKSQTTNERQGGNGS